MRWLLYVVPTYVAANAIIYSPGRAPVFIQDRDDGYSIVDSERGVTQVLDVPGFKMIQPSQGAPTYIIGDTPMPQPVVPLQPNVVLPIPGEPEYAM
jgi:hypothetical protein